MRIVLAVAAGVMLASLAATGWDDLRFSSLDDLAADDLRQAEVLSTSHPDSALSRLQRTPPALRSDRHILLQVSLLAQQQRDSTVIAVVEGAGRCFQERAFADYLGPYLQACRRTGQLERFQRFVNGLRYVQGERSKRTMLGGVLSLMDSGRHEEARQMLQLFPPEMFPAWSWEVLAAAADRYTGREPEALARIDRLLGLHADGASQHRKQEPMPAVYRAVLYDLKLLATPRDSLTSSDLMILSSAPLRATRRNLVSLALAHGLTDFAAAKLEELPSTDSTRVLAAMLEWHRGEPGMADALLALVNESHLLRHRQAMLLRAELDYHGQRYQQAERDYKQYLRMDTHPSLCEDDMRYANYAIGWAFHGYFRYNNAAYWWIKNLLPQGTDEMDSLATADLAQLYTFTGHPQEARRYYRRLAQRYPTALQGESLTAYLDNMREIGEYGSLHREFSRLYESVAEAQRPRFARVLADVFYERGDYAAARSFYKLLPPAAVDDEVIWRRERCALLLGEDEDTVAFLRRFLAGWPQSPYAVRAGLDLMRFYLQTGEPEEALALPMPVAAPADTLLLLRAGALAQLGRQQAARDSFAVLLRTDAPQPLRLLAVQQMDTLYAAMPLAQLSRHYAALAGQAGDAAVSEAILLRLAARFEREELHREANEIYITLLADSTRADTSIARLRLASNLLHLNRYEAAQTTLRPIERNLTHAHRAEALYIDHLADLALQRPGDARRKLLDIFLSYPESPRKAEVLVGLARLYDQSEQPLLSWYFYAQALPLLGPAQAGQVRQRLAALQAMLGEDTLGLRQPLVFRNLLMQVERATSP